MEQGTKLIRCNCVSEFQDKTYGKGIRVANRNQGGKQKMGSTCTVCSKEHA